MPSIVSCLCWVEKGKSKETPDKVELDKTDLDTLIQTSDNVTASRSEDEAEDGDAMEQEVTNHSVVENEEEDIDNLYRLDKYDLSDYEEETNGEKMTVGGLSGLTYYASNDDDPYITLKVEQNESEDFQIRSDDNLLLIGKAEDEFSSIEVHVFNESDNHSFCHHELLINAYPLALEWLDYDLGQPEEKGNFVAIGSMSPAIEIWDLDLVDALEPVAVLGMTLETIEEMMTMAKNKIKKKKKKKKHKHLSTESKETAEEMEAAASVSDAIDTHLDAVMGLSWNKIVRSLLASASADNTTKIWDLSEQKTLLTLDHPDKVQSLEWHPTEPSLLATGCYDGIVRLFNCEDGSLLKNWKLNGEIEKLIWNHFQPDLLLVSTEHSQVYCLNKSTDTLHFSIHAHTEAITDISLSCQVPGLLVTSSTDDTIKFWDIYEKSPVFLYSRSMHMGAVLCSKFCQDNPYILAVGGQKNSFQLMNVLSQQSLYEKCCERGLTVPDTTADPTGDITDNEEQEVMESGGGEANVCTASSGKSVVKRKKDKKNKKLKKTI